LFMANRFLRTGPSFGKPKYKAFIPCHA
jgi:hypothetical protein